MNSNSGHSGQRPGDSIRSAGEILRNLLDENQNRQAQEYYRFFSAWDEIVGENLAGRARAKELKGSTLIVEVDHPGWIQLLEMRQAKILHELRERFPALKIEKIRFYVSGEPGRAPGDPSKTPGGREGKAGEPERPQKNHGEAQETQGPAREDQEEEQPPSSKQRLDSVLERLGEYIEPSGDGETSGEGGSSWDGGDEESQQ